MGDAMPPSTTTTGRPKVAVIGSGLAGLATAYLLAEGGVEVWLIEKAPRLGFYSHSVELDNEREHDDRPGSPVSTASISSSASTSSRSSSTSITSTSTLAAATPAQRRASSSSTGSNGCLSPTIVSEPMSRRCSSSSGRLSPVSCVSPVRRISSSSLSPAVVSEPMSRRSSEEKYGEVFSGRHVGPPRRRPSSIIGAGEGTVVDVPMRSFQGGYYPQLLALYRHLGFKPEASSYTFSFAELGQRAYFTYEGASGVSLPSLPSAAWRSLVTLVLSLAELLLAGVCYALFLGLAFLTWHSLLPARLQKASFGAVIDATAEVIDRPLRWGPRTRLGHPFRRFVSRLVIPLFSAVGTMTVPDVLSAPAEPLLDYVHAGVGTAHYSLGPISSRDVAMALASPPGIRLRLGISVTGIRYANGRLHLALDGGEEAFDRVVLATEASASLKLLESLEFDMTLAGRGRDRGRIRRIQKIRKEVLRSVQYRESLVVTHTDAESVIPPGDRRVINLVLPSSDPKNAGTWTNRTVRGSDEKVSKDSRAVSNGIEAPYFPPEAGYVMATHETRGVLQTTNPICPIAAGKVLGVAKMERALPFNSDPLLSLLTGQPLPRSSPAAAPQAQTYHARSNGSATSPDIQVSAPSPPLSRSNSVASTPVRRSNSSTYASLSRSNSTIERRTASSTSSCSSSSTEEDESPLVHLVGSYAYPGIPLLEGCVGSARRVAREILGRDPDVDWEAGMGGFFGRAWRWRRQPRVGGLL